MSALGFVAFFICTIVPTVSLEQDFQRVGFSVPSCIRIASNTGRQDAKLSDSLWCIGEDISVGRGAPRIEKFPSFFYENEIISRNVPKLRIDHSVRRDCGRHGAALIRKNEIIGQLDISQFIIHMNRHMTSRGVTAINPSWARAPKGCARLPGNSMGNITKPRMINISAISIDHCEPRSYPHKGNSPGDRDVIQAS